MSDDVDFAALDDLFGDLAARLGPGERKRLTRTIARDLRAANAARIAANVTPDGEPMVPRKPKDAGRLRRARERGENRAKPRALRKARMFAGAARPRFLRAESSADEAQVGYAGAAARIMAVHHYGLTDAVSRDPGAPTVHYPARPVVGLTAEDRARLLALAAGQVGA